MSYSSKRNDLLDELEAWFDREGLISERLWNEEGINLHRKLLLLDPENVMYKTTLAKLLVEQGWDEKLRYVNYRSACELFTQALEQDPKNYRANYHLGFLDSYQNNWGRAVEHFRLAIEHPGLGKVRILRALCEYAVCLSWLDDLEGAMDALNRAKELSKENPALEHEVRSAEQRLKHEPVFNSTGTCIVTTAQGKHLVPAWAADEIELQVEEADEICLDLRPRRPKFTGPLDTVLLEPKVAKLVALLMNVKGPVQSDFIMDYLWPESSNPDLVRRYMYKLRNALRSCYPKENADLVQTISGRYQWLDKRPFSIIEYAGASAQPFAFRQR